MKKILIVFGTRPEAIKMAPVIRLFKAANDQYDTRICVTGQHREMLDQVLSFFEIVPDYDLNLMKGGQSLSELSAAVLLGMEPLLYEFKPDYLFVHGDTTTSAIAALAGLYAQVKVCHIEAGLRTYNLDSPFPEEANRQLTARLAQLHFAPTSIARDNLLAEGVPPNRIHLTGNTVIDALEYAKDQVEQFEPDFVKAVKAELSPKLQTILVTCHRRENIGKGFLEICAALRTIVRKHPVQLVYPVHLNPKIREIAFQELSGCSHIHLVEPLDYPSFIWMMKTATIMITDSGGVQEEASALGKPIVLMRDNTERPEVISSGHVRLVGANKERIESAVAELLKGEVMYAVSQSEGSSSLTGTGASKMIFNIIGKGHV